MWLILPERPFPEKNSRTSLSKVIEIADLWRLLVLMYYAISSRVIIVSEKKVLRAIFTFWPPKIGLSRSIHVQVNGGDLFIEWVVSFLHHGERSE